MLRITEVIAVVVLIGWTACQSFLINHGCGYNPADIVFLLDSSGSVGSANFQKMKDFAALFSQAFDISPSKVQVGIVTFASTPHNEFNLNIYGNERDLANDTRHIPYRTGGTRTDLALTYVEANSFTSQSGDRQNVPDTLIVITDGKSNQPALTLAETVQLHQRNIKVLAIGVGTGADDVELGHIASDPKYVYHLPAFDDLTTLQTDLKIAVCQVDGLWSLWSSWGVCSASIGCGHTSRARTCTSSSAPRGAPCYGSSSDKTQCGTCPVCKDNPSSPGLCGIPGVCLNPVKRECLATCGLCDSVLLPR